MRELSDNEFVDVFNNGNLAVILIKTPNCPKCKVIAKKIEDAGNQMDVLSYTVRNPSDEARAILETLGVASVPFVFMTEKDMETSQTKNTIYRDIKEIEAEFANPNWTLID
jgi:glutaredoxin